MKTAGVVLDFYDDPSGTVLKKNFPTVDSLPETVKTAHILSPEEREVLRDEAYALVLVNEGKTLRKFACVDAGNTLLSALYFEEFAGRLPEEAQKVAAANILAACEEFGLPVRTLEKIAASASRKRDPMRQPIVGEEQDWAERTNLTSIRGGVDGGRVMSAASTMKTASDDNPKNGKNRGGVIHETHDFSDLKLDQLDPKKVKKYVEELKKKGDVNLDSHHKLNPEAKPKEKKAESPNGGMKLTDEVRAVPVTAKAPKLQTLKKPEDHNAFSIGPGKGDLEVNFKKISNTVDVSGQEAPTLVEEKTASHYALGDRYPLDSFGDVKAAVFYFQDNYLDMDPKDRHEYAVKTAARAEELGIPVTGMLERYGSTDYAPDVDAHLANRRAVAPEFTSIWNELQEKRASLEPETFAQLLAEADEVSGIIFEYGSESADAYFATFGGNKVKEANAAWNWQSRVGDYVSGDQLHKLARNGRPLVEKQFTKDLADAFSKDPITIFESLPDIQKKLLARLASQEFDGLPTN